MRTSDRELRRAGAQPFRIDTVVSTRRQRSGSCARLALGTLLAWAGCKGDDDDRLSGVDDRLLDPKTCESCHPQHYHQWLGSMHAYAAEDPVFRAMNARGQRETHGALGDFCVKCHAPMAVELGLTHDGLNLDEVPQHLQGVTCYFCHTVAAVEGTHNNPLRLARNDVMLGAIRDPVRTDAHRSSYSPHLDAATMESADLCGSCHDIVTEAGVHLERTYVEWLDSFMSDVDPLSGQPASYGQRCGNCHMGPPIDGPIADAPGVRGDRKFHPHLMGAVDVALTNFPDAQLGPQLRAEQLAYIEERRRPALCASICVNPNDEGGSNVDVYLHNEHSAHAWPSGAAQDRRAWLELRVWAGDDEVFRSGVVPEGTPVAELEDPHLWQMRDFVYDDAGNEAHMFWDVREVRSRLLPAASVLDPETDRLTWQARRYRVDTADVSRVTTRVRLRPMGFDVLDSLIASGDLDPAVRDAMPVFDYAPTVLEWTLDEATEYEDYGPCVNSSSGCGGPIPEVQAEMPSD
jgi:hypothetical protein